MKRSNEHSFANIGLPLEKALRAKLSEKCRLTDAYAIQRHLQQTNSIRAFADYLFDGNDSISRNAAWVLTKENDFELQRLVPLYDKLIDLAMQTSNTSLKRLTLNIIHRMPANKDTLRVDFLNFCMEHMSMHGEMPGAQALCMKIAHQLCQFHPDLLHEFHCIAESMDTRRCAPSVNCVRKKTIKKGV